MKKSPPKNEKPNEQEENIKKMWKEIPFYFWFPLLAGIIIIAFGGDLDIQFVVSTVILFGIGFLGIWLIYK
ncbi:MAG: hypothetical protein OET79_17100, partial [Nitrospirota bacterium]|nr:hypothetical protein [Nitrospirota bacterium]